MVKVSLADKLILKIQSSKKRDIDFIYIPTPELPGSGSRV